MRPRRWADPRRGARAARGAAGGSLLAGRGGDELVEDCLLVFLRAEDAPEALDVLALGGAAGEDDGDVRVGDVDALVQDVRGDDGPVAADTEPVQDLLPLFSRRLVGYARDQEAAGERVDFLDALGEDDAPVVPVLAEQGLERVALAHRALPDLAPPPR